jgi:hypothetical protein
MGWGHRLALRHRSFWISPRRAPLAHPGPSTDIFTLKRASHENGAKFADLRAIRDLAADQFAKLIKRESVTPGTALGWAEIAHAAAGIVNDKAPLG